MTKSLYLARILIWLIVADTAVRCAMVVSFHLAPSAFEALWPAGYHLLNSVSLWQMAVPLIVLPAVAFFAWNIRQRPAAALIYISIQLIAHGVIVAISVVTTPGYFDHPGHYLFLVEGITVILLSRHLIRRAES
ncbi:hypothetical protein [Maricaulis parjimensis]|uniref:hypothetical protein n=1 Tax=Maricaulis parjimensis TaxID=144023 RepID=UPI0019394FFC|nr:hypothetical protein [Maricaulis parjimensis]